jgi:DNA-binding CsgD family transcriptional regulator
MSDLEALSSALDAVYDAAIDANLWPLAVERACNFVQCMAGMIGAYDVMLRGLNFRIPWGYEQKYLDNFDYYTSINPTLRSSFAFKVGQVGSIGDVLDLKEFYAHRVYLEWAKPQGIVDVVQATLEKSPTALSVLALSRHESQGIVDQPTRDRMAMIVPHFRRSVLIGKIIDLAKIEAATFSNAIDGLAAAVFLVTREGRLLHANVRGEEMLSAGDPLRLVEAVVTAASHKVQRDLLSSFAAATEGHRAIEQRGVAVPLMAADDQRYVAHVLPMTSGRRREATVLGQAAAALFVRKVDLRFPSAVDTMTQIYRLTPSETRVLHVILEAGGVAPTSLMLRLTENTVKTHLRHIFAKTGARNQADLVKLAAGLASPLSA